MRQNRVKNILLECPKTKEKKRKNEKGLRFSAKTALFHAFEVSAKKKKNGRSLSPEGHRKLMKWLNFPDQSRILRKKWFTGRNIRTKPKNETVPAKN